MPRQAAPSEGANRASGSEFLGRLSNPQATTVDFERLAAALQRGATLYIGSDETSLRLGELQRQLKSTFPFDDSYRHARLVAPTAICAHWLGFTGRRSALNHRYPATFLRELITTCFGFDYADIPMDAVLGGLVHQGFHVEKVKGKSRAVFNWAANIRSVTYLPATGGRWIRITELGKRGAIPPMRISE
jgi:hypothetical protein